MKNLFLTLIALITLFNCSSDDDSSNTPTEAENVLLRDNLVLQTPYAHLFVVPTGNEEYSYITISNNNKEDWSSYRGDIHFFEFDLDKKTIVEGNFTFLNNTDSNFNPNTNFSYAASAITTMDEEGPNDRTETWYDTDDDEGSVVSNSSIKINKVDDSTYEIIYSITIDEKVISGYYKGELNVVIDN